MAPGAETSPRPRALTPATGLGRNQPAHVVDDSVPLVAEGPSPGPNPKQRNRPCHALRPLLRQTKPNLAKGPAFHAHAAPAPGFPSPSCHLSRQSHFPSISPAPPPPRKVMGISSLYYYFALSISQPIVDHANGIINLGDSKKIYGALHFCIGHHGTEEGSVNLGDRLGLELAPLWN